MSFVTAAMLYSSRNARESASIRAVLPDPTGLGATVNRNALLSFATPAACLLACKERQKNRGTESTNPPIPIVNARSFQSRPSISGISRLRYEPGPSSISCEWPCVPPSCACAWLWLWLRPSCEWVCELMAGVVVAGGGIKTFVRTLAGWKMGIARSLVRYRGYHLARPPVTNERLGELRSEIQ